MNRRTHTDGMKGHKIVTTGTENEQGRMAALIGLPIGTTVNGPAQWGTEKRRFQRTAVISGKGRQLEGSKL